MKRQCYLYAVFLPLALLHLSCANAYMDNSKCILEEKYYGVGHITEIYSDLASMNILSFTRSRSVSNTTNRYFYREAYENGSERFYECNSTDSQSELSIYFKSNDASYSAPGINPSACEINESIYLLFMGPDGSIDLYKRGSIDNAQMIVNYIRDNTFNSTNIVNALRTGNPAFIMESNIQYVHVFCPCFRNNKLFFNVSTRNSSGNVSVAIYYSTLDGNVFSVPKKIRGKAVDTDNWIGRIYIAPDFGQAYFTVMNHALLASDLGRDDPYSINVLFMTPNTPNLVCNYIVTCDIDDKGEFGNRYFYSLSSNINSTYLNFLTDVSSDGTAIKLYVAHLSKSAVDSSGKGWDGYVLDSFANGLSQMPAWASYGYVSALTIQ